MVRGRGIGDLNGKNTRWDRSITLVMLAAIMLLAIFTYINGMNTIKKEACRYNRQNIMYAIELYEANCEYDRWEDFGSCMNSLIQGKYLTKVPVCLDEGRYRMGKDNEGRTIIVCSKHRTRQ